MSTGNLDLPPMTTWCRHHQPCRRLMTRTTLLLLLFLHLPQINSIPFRNDLVAFASPSIPPPPPISMPVWSLACPSPNNGDTSMNIVTFATPVSVAPPKLWIVSLYTNTTTRDCCINSGVGVLQLLTPSQQDLVPILGKRSGYEEGYFKRDECQAVGQKWVSDNGDFLVEVDGNVPSLDLLPNCAVYIQLKLLSTTDAGDHDVALMEVVSTGVWSDSLRKVVSTDVPPAALDPTTALYTAQLRKEGII